MMWRESVAYIVERMGADIPEMTKERDCRDLWDVMALDQS
jgi:hypothetical protein